MTLLISEPERKNRILAQFADNKDERFLMEECFMWTLEPKTWQDMEIIHNPVPPEKWVDYEGLSTLGKSKMEEEFFHSFVIKEYLQKKSSVLAHNYGHWNWLKQMRKFFPRDNEHLILHEKIKEKLDEFYQWLIRNHPQLFIHKAPEAQSKAQPEEQSPEVETIKDIFDAENIY